VHDAAVAGRAKRKSSKGSGRRHGPCADTGDQEHGHTRRHRGASRHAWDVSGAPVLHAVRGGLTRVLCFSRSITVTVQCQLLSRE
jgi:hypothetical protein